MNNPICDINIRGEKRQISHSLVAIEVVLLEAYGRRSLSLFFRCLSFPDLKRYSFTARLIKFSSRQLTLLLYHRKKIIL